MALIPDERRSGPCFCFCDFFRFYANLEFSADTLRRKKIKKMKILIAPVIGAEVGEEEEKEEKKRRGKRTMKKIEGKNK